MLNIGQITLVFLSALTVIVGDSIVKKIAIQGFWAAFKDPLMIVVYALYLAQILFAIYIFVYKGELVAYTNLYIVFYSILGVISSILFFNESISVVQIIGIALALIGAYLINLG